MKTRTQLPDLYDSVCWWHLPAHCTCYQAYLNHAVPPASAALAYSCQLIPATGPWHLLGGNHSELSAPRFSQGFFLPPLSSGLSLKSPPQRSLPWPPHLQQPFSLPLCLPPASVLLSSLIPNSSNHFTFISQLKSNRAPCEGVDRHSPVNPSPRAVPGGGDWNCSFVEYINSKPASQQPPCSLSFMLNNLFPDNGLKISHLQNGNEMYAQTQEPY